MVKPFQRRHTQHPGEGRAYRCRTQILAFLTSQSLILIDRLPLLTWKWTFSPRCARERQIHLFLLLIFQKTLLSKRSMKIISLISSAMILHELKVLIHHLLTSDPLMVRLTYLQHGDRKSTRLNSSHQIISYAVFCLKKKNHSN